MFFQSPESEEFVMEERLLDGSVFFEPEGWTQEEMEVVRVNLYFVPGIVVFFFAILLAFTKEYVVRSTINPEVHAEVWVLNAKISSWLYAVRRLFSKRP